MVGLAQPMPKKVSRSQLDHSSIELETRATRSSSTRPRDQSKMLRGEGSKQRSQGGDDKRSKEDTQNTNQGGHRRG
ncbi:unnamed protein product [Microthlaspi erraticum]|uniref:Uncharacterized protein n=1 Tax=Microthlaspi erraticum TaxID=1685480 RepID=A0A6D2JAY9_9BRAS|nr:unnamed protein product [Microthlaspi erraticum]